MSVLACGRYGCPNIMCDNMILNRSYYICDECLDELKAHRSRMDGASEEEVRSFIEEFMESEKTNAYSSPDNLFEEVLDLETDW